MNPREITKDQVVSMYSIAFFVVLTTAAVAMDLLYQWVKTLGVSTYTYLLIALTAHVMLTLDVVLFLVALFVTGWQFVKEVGKWK